MMSRINVVLLLLTVALALVSVNASHRARKLISALEVEQKRMRELDVEWGQLRLEQSTWAAHARIEKIARERLHMHAPQAGQLVLIEAGRDSASRESAVTN